MLSKLKDGYTEVASMVSKSGVIDEYIIEEN